jgi:hypothetical protein
MARNINTAYPARPAGDECTAVHTPFMTGEMCRPHICINYAYSNLGK